MGNNPSNTPSKAGSQNLKRLVLSNQKLSSLQPFYPKLTSRIQELVLANNQLTELPSDKFSSMLGLELLDATMNQISKIPAEIGVLDKLKELLLSQNRITAIPPEIGKFASLSILELTANQIRKIPKELGNLASLTRLDLSSNLIEEVDDTIGSLYLLRLLRLRANQIKTLSPKISELKQLESLDLRQNFLTTLPENFALENLSDLLLTQNDLTELPATLPENCPNLTEVEASQNKLTSLGNLSHLGLLRRLTVDFNKIPSIPDLNGLITLSELNLCDNNITELPAELGFLHTLEVLLVARNKLKAIPKSIGNLTRLEFLDVSNNKLEKLPKSISNLTKLDKLLLDDNKLTVVPRQLCELKRLKFLCLGMNQLTDTSFKQGCFEGMTSLLELRLFCNKLTKLPNEISELQTLEKLLASSNELTELPNAITGLVDLKIVHLGDNKFENFPPQLFALTQLRNLWICMNKITTIPAGISVLTSLQTLDVSCNKLTSLPKLDGFKDMHELVVSRNELTSIPSSIANVAELFCLDASFNKKLTSISKDILPLFGVNHLKFIYCGITSYPAVTNAHLPSIRWVALEGNPIEGDTPLRLQDLTDIRDDTVTVAEHLVKSSCFYDIDVSELQGMRPTMEDAYTIRDTHPILANDYQFRFMAIYDGHADAKAAEYCACHFAEFLQTQLKKYINRAIKSARKAQAKLHRSTSGNQLTTSPSKSSIDEATETPDEDALGTSPGGTPFKKPKIPKAASSPGISVRVSREKKNKLKNGSIDSTPNSKPAEPAAAEATDAPKAEEKEREKRTPKKTKSIITSELASSAPPPTNIPEETEPMDESASTISLLKVVPKAIKNTFTELREKIFALDIESGCTVAAAVVLDNHLWLCSCGDARITACIGDKAQRCTIDHKSTDQVERLRVQELGGFLTPNGRIFGKIAIARALGDADFYPYVTSDPYIYHAEITDEYRFLIIACDGLWDVISDEQAVQIVSEYYAKTSTYVGASVLLRDIAYELGSGDNISVIVAGLRGVEKTQPVEFSPNAPPPQSNGDSPTAAPTTTTPRKKRRDRKDKEKDGSKDKEASASTATAE